MSEQTLNKTAVFANLPAEWPDDLLPAIQAQVAASARKIVVLDDDPTGTQTVYDIPVLTEWPVALLRQELLSDTAAFYILTNSRSMPLPMAQALNQTIGHNLMAASNPTPIVTMGDIVTMGEDAGAETNRRGDFVVVSRSDSTLRGHYPGETDALVAALQSEIDATLLVPFFLEGGRYTIDDVHYVAEGDQLVPAAETPFAQDAVFGYKHSNLREWVEEKTEGRVAAPSVASISLDDIRRGGPTQVADKLCQLNDGAVCIINAVSMRDIQVFVLGLLQAETLGKKFLYRTAASFVQVRAGLTARPLLSATELTLPSSSGGLIVVGSYVPKTTSQLSELLAQPDVVQVEVNVAMLLDDNLQATEIQRATHVADQALRQGQDVVVYTSRGLVTAGDTGGSLAIGQRVSESLVAIVRAIQTRPRYLLAKGGITSSDVATKALDVRRALVLGQILPGVPVWRTGAESLHPDLIYIVFPGNVGDVQALARVVTTLKAEKHE
ncbi:four-carbon acid sugar kinase family protein [soil metagenome]